MRTGRSHWSIPSLAIMRVEQPRSDWRLRVCRDLRVEAAHLVERGPQAIARERRVLEEAVVPVANLIARREDDRDAIRLDQGVVAVAGRDEPGPLLVGE